MSHSTLLVISDSFFDKFCSFYTKKIKILNFFWENCVSLVWMFFLFKKNFLKFWISQNSRKNSGRNGLYSLPVDSAAFQAPLKGWSRQSFITFQPFFKTDPCYQALNLKDPRALHLWKTAPETTLHFERVITTVPFKILRLSRKYPSHWKSDHKNGLQNLKTLHKFLPCENKQVWPWSIITPKC
jgi:hypothetical protein